jgi:hypothetical protein
MMHHVDATSKPTTPHRSSTFVGGVHLRHVENHQTGAASSEKGEHHLAIQTTLEHAKQNDTFLSGINVEKIQGTENRMVAKESKKIFNTTSLPPSSTFTTTNDVPSLRNEVENMFYNIDRNHDGSVTRTELLIALRRDPDLAERLELASHVHQEGRSRVKFEEVFRSIDADSSTTISMDEFCGHFLRVKEAAFGGESLHVDHMRSDAETKPDRRTVELYSAHRGDRARDSRYYQIPRPNLPPRNNATIPPLVDSLKSEFQKFTSRIEKCMDTPSPFIDMSSVNEELKDEVLKLHKKLQSVHVELQQSKWDNEQLYTLANRYRVKADQAESDASNERKLFVSKQEEISQIKVLLQEKNRLLNRRLQDLQQALSLAKRRENELKDVVTKSNLYADLEARKSESLSQEVLSLKRLKEMDTQNNKTMLMEWRHYVRKMEMKVEDLYDNEKRLIARNDELDVIIKSQSVKLATRKYDLGQSVEIVNEPSHAKAQQKSSPLSVKRESYLEEELKKYDSRETQWKMEKQEYERKIKSLETDMRKYQRQSRLYEEDLHALKSEIQTLTGQYSTVDNPTLFCVKFGLKLDSDGRANKTLKTCLLEHGLEVESSWVPDDQRGNKMVVLVRESNPYSGACYEAGRPMRVLAKVKECLKDAVLDGRVSLLLPSTSVMWWMAGASATNTIDEYTSNYDHSMVDS